MLKIKQIEKGDLNLKKLIELSMKFDVYSLWISKGEDDILAGKKLKHLKIVEIENRIKRPEEYAFVYVEKEKKS